MNAVHNFSAGSIAGLFGAILFGLQLQAQPVNDNFASRAKLEGTNLVTSTSNVGATMEPNEPVYHDAGQVTLSGASLWWTWTPPFDCVCTIDTSASLIQTFVGAYTGSGFGDLMSESVAYDSIRFDAVKGVAYQIFVDGSYGVTGSIQLRLNVAPQMVGLPAPAWTLQTPTGATLRSTDFAGKVLLLDFWATWCTYCLREIPDFVALQAQYGPDGFAVVGVSVDDTADIVKRFMQTSTPTINYAVVMADNKIEDAFGGITGYPTTFVIDRNNIVRRKFIGQRSKSTFVSSLVPFLYGKLELSRGESWALRWRPDGAPVLEHTPSMSAPVWTRWTGAPQMINGMNVLQMPEAETGFFRLNYSY